ncbi:hypothetical protein FLA_3311 [Filimonas lacunae]|nr:hypothetical protein FLA_3311 [Filimonas lacunae]
MNEIARMHLRPVTKIGSVAGGRQALIRGGGQTRGWIRHPAP